MNEVIHELGFDEVAKKYPGFPRTIIRKIDTALRGVMLTERALERAKEEGALCNISADTGPGCFNSCFTGNNPKSAFLFGAVFGDGTWVLGLETYLQQPPDKAIRKDNPYTLDVIGEKLYLVDSGEPVDEVHFVPAPGYYGKKTSRGILMSEVVTARFPNSLGITVLHCYFDQERNPCKFCYYATPYFRRKEESHTPENLEDIYETVKETLEEDGRWMGIHLVGGSDPRGNSPYENEAEEEIKILKTLKRCFGSTCAGEKLPVRAVASAFPREQLLRLREAGLTVYNSHIEVWDKRLFELICPGKAKYFGRQYWIDSILSAVEIFGRGNVSTQLVAGAELAQPYGFKDIDEALASNLEGVDFFARNGVHTTFCILWVGQGSVFYREKQKLPSLEYYVRLAKGINEIRKKYRLNVDSQDYRRWANFPDTDLARLAS